MTSDSFKEMVSAFPDPFKQVISNNVSYSIDPKQASARVLCIVGVVSMMIDYSIQNGVKVPFNDMNIYWIDDNVIIDFLGNNSN